MTISSAAGCGRNHLSGEKSPYLQQHADNPVDWYPWGEEAFARARREDKPVFLSIGYSTCHWCHVMEEESFRNPEVAELLNRHFICVKVDREERPDVDHDHMLAVQAFTGTGGWPLTVFLTPEGEPFFGGTYFPPDDLDGRMGLKTLALRIAGAWQTDRDQLRAGARRFAGQVRAMGRAAGPANHTPSALGRQTVDAAYAALEQAFDPDCGGFSRQPKFPSVPNLFFLTRYGTRTGAPDAWLMAALTLRAMARGGIRDQLGGGFHRYATDRRWRWPHFEKMLYDQALLGRACLEMVQITGEAEFAQAAGSTLDYVLRDLRSPEGGFFTAEDADSLTGEGTALREGAYYLWRQDELQRVLGETGARVLGYHFGTQAAGNAPEDPRGELAGLNVLAAARSVEATARHFRRPVPEVRSIITEGAEALRRARSARKRPRRDEKVLADTNGLMISALATGARVLGQPRYLAAATAAAEFVLTRLRAGDGTLRHVHCGGEAAVAGLLDDHAFMAQGLLDLYEAGAEIGFLRSARELAGTLITKFWDPERGGFFFSPAGQEGYAGRQKAGHDGAVPSGNAVGAETLLRLGRLTRDRSLAEYARQTLTALAGEVLAAPAGYLSLLSVWEYDLDEGWDVVIAAGKDPGETEEIMDLVHSRFLFPKQIAVRPWLPRDRQRAEEVLGHLKDYEPREDRATVYLCRGRVCRPAVIGPDRFREFLDEECPPRTSSANRTHPDR